MQSKASRVGSLPPEPVASRLASVLRAVDPYALNPVTLLLGRIRGSLEYRGEAGAATFGVSNVWEGASVLHTLRKERRVLSALSSDLRSDDVFYDVGANLGAFTCTVGAVPEHTVSFEPHPRNGARLRANADRNGIGARIVDRALSDESGTASLSAEGWAGNQRHALISGGSAPGDQSTVEVETVAGDDLVERGEVPPPTVLKIDVEGAEAAVLTGLSETLSRPDCRLVYCEVHPELLPEFGADVTAVRERLADAGFDVEAVGKGGGQAYLRAEK